MTLTDPRPLLQEIDSASYKSFLPHHDQGDLPAPDYVEPSLGPRNGNIKTDKPKSEQSAEPPKPDLAATGDGCIKSKVIRLGDFVDTDALAPAEFLMAAKDDEELGSHCMEHVYPEFRSLVRGGQRVVVGGEAFGCGSSREQVVSALKGLGVEAVIARSYSFIYGRNQPSLGLLGIRLEEDEFYRLAADQEDIAIDIPHRLIHVAGKTFHFHLAEMEYTLTVNKGLQASYKKFGREIWKHIAANIAGTGAQALDLPPGQLGGLLTLEPEKEREIDW